MKNLIDVKNCKKFVNILILFSEAAVRRCSTEYVFLKFRKNSQENIYAGVTF